MTDSKKRAAISAVINFIKTEQEANYEQSLTIVPKPLPQLWGINGRQMQMQMRNLMQMKTFHNSNPKCNL